MSVPFLSSMNILEIVFLAIVKYGIIFTYIQKLKMSKFPLLYVLTLFLTLFIRKKKKMFYLKS